MARPWKKNWPYQGKRGKSWSVGFYDHEGVERSRSFATARGVGGAREWMAEYSAAERRGPDSLRRFLLDLDAVEANEAEGRPIGEIIELYFKVDAHPDLEGGLAPSTYAVYRNAAKCHLLGDMMHNKKGEPVGRAAYAIELARQPAKDFNRPDAPRKWREEMRAAGTTSDTVKRAWRKLSSILSWAASSHLVPEIQTNGCILANERSSSRRRSVRRGGSGRAAPTRRSGSQVPSWALSPQAVEAIRDAMLARVDGRDPIFAERDAALLSLQYGMASRPQEAYAMRWMSLGADYAEIMEVISHGKLEEWGKTSRSTGRRTTVPSIAIEDMARWNAKLVAWGYPTRPEDFIIPGNLDPKWGVLDRETDAYHFSLNMTRLWRARSFRPAVAVAARERGLAAIEGATPYAIRRGGISVRLRAEDPQTVADECGTSLQMLDAHYAFAIDDLRRFGPRPFDVEWREARAARRDDSNGPVLALVA
jgi:hypothetical protein